LEEHGRIERSPENRPVRMIGISRDITERKRIEEGLKHELRTNEMFVGVLSHDLRNPIGGVLMVAELGMEAAQGAAAKKSFERIADSAKRMLRMVEQLLDLTRIRMAHGLELRRERSDLRVIIAAVIAELEAANPQAELALEVLGNAGGRWDPDRLGQVVSNLVGNAIQHATGSRRIDVRVDGTGDAVVKLRVCNSGTIPADLVPVLFEPFKRGASEAKKTMGLGLGLFIAKQIALAHGGDLRAHSDSAGGTTFELVLPREPEHGAAHAPAAIPHASGRNRRR
jgi:signal transduction histidine kinase